MSSAKDTPSSQAPQGRMKRIIVCCDGTWMSSVSDLDTEPPSNVTRIARGISQTCLDGTPQVIFYHPGVGSAGSKLDRFTGGAFGMGLDIDIRYAYSFICSNYVGGDEIVLIGFSRGAFTARSTADMIGSLGLLTPAGLDHFSSIFSDYESMGDEDRDPDLFLSSKKIILPPFEGEKGAAKSKKKSQRMQAYKSWLIKQGYTSEKVVQIKAIGVWDTVGTLGIPPAPVFTDTQISEVVENAFQALALDEPRFAYRPTLWERPNQTKTRLKQVWFPGNHGGVGGGWEDQQMSDIALAWMCDQLSTIGIQFNLQRMKDVFMQDLSYLATHPYPLVPVSTWSFGSRPNSKPWAIKPICPGTERGQKADASKCVDTEDHPYIHLTGTAQTLWATARPWGLGQTRYPTSWIQVAAGKTVRHPGTFKRADPDTNKETDEPLVNTEERIHSCVRVRLACQGLEMDDGSVWECKALTKADDGGPLWKLEKGTASEISVAQEITDFQPNELKLWGSEYGGESLYQPQSSDGQWRWVYKGAGKLPVTTLPEEPLVGYWERLLLAMMVGQTDVWRWAEENPPAAVMART